jgi:hypothetical protein
MWPRFSPFGPLEKRSGTKNSALMTNAATVIARSVGRAYRRCGAVRIMGVLMCFLLVNDEPLAVYYRLRQPHDARGGEEWRTQRREAHRIG